MADYVCGFLFGNSGDPPNEQVALVLKSRPAWQAGKLNGVGGKIEPGEAPIDAMIREFQEETGLDSNKEKFVWLQQAIMTGPGWQVTFYSAFTPDTPELCGSLDEPVYWYPIRELPSNMIAHARWLVPFCLDFDMLKPIQVRDVTRQT